MIKNILVLAGILFCTITFSQDMTKFKLYNPEANAKKDIERVTKEAKDAGKHVLIQIGGNWCVWCARFNDFVTKDSSLDSLVKANYVTYHLNYSKENKNSELLAKYEFPQRFGFPVFLVLNEKGDLLHTQTSWYLEAGKGYDKEKVTAFFNDWGKKAFDPAQYKEE
ncbi:thioredoxin family protein [Chitinophagaceae bacterium IBVUCB2]|nr:thioredoxin family protein [Chitinophagaceae bacterium IBVUCB2]